MNVLVACEESQAVCKAFRARGHNAYSCDILECSGGHPEWHFKQDVLQVIPNHGGVLENEISKWCEMAISSRRCSFANRTKARTSSSFWKKKNEGRSNRVFHGVY